MPARLPLCAPLALCLAALALVAAAKNAHAQEAEPSVTAAPGGATAPGVSLEVAVNRPDTRVLLDRVFVGHAPWAGRVAAGPHHLRLEHATFRPWEGTVLVLQGETQQLRAVLRPPPSRTAAHWTLLGALGATLTGTVFGALALATRSGLESALALGRLEERDGRVPAGVAYAVTADVFWVGALALACAGVYLAVLDPPPRSDARLVPLRRPRPAERPATEGGAPPAGEDSP